MIQLQRLNAVVLRVRNLDASLAWYCRHFGFEAQYEVEGGLLVSTGAIELVLSPHPDPDAPLADPLTMRCIQTLAFEIPESEFTNLRTEFAADPDLVELDHPRYHSLITGDPDGYCVELYYNKTP
jgi:catechol 2,3-dioxygenase-like lactoylglutathione lyase family enzyme